MREYELTVVYDLAVMEAGGPDASVQQLTHVVENRGGKVTRIDHWGRRRMAYPIRRTVDADYIVSRVELEPGAVEQLESTLRIDERVYRHMIVRADELPVPAPPREQRPVATEAQGQPPAEVAGPDIDTTPEAAAPAGSHPPAEAVSAAEAVARAEALTAEQLAPEPAAESAPPIVEALRDTSPETSTTGFASRAAEENTGISVDDLESHKPTGPHTQEDTTGDETTA
jgi:small subunit ribosomal protein S6